MFSVFFVFCFLFLLSLYLCSSYFVVLFVATTFVVTKSYSENRSVHSQFLSKLISAIAEHANKFLFRTYKISHPEKLEIGKC